jgi:hypothetical protein
MMGIRTNTQDAVFNNLPWFDADIGRDWIPDERRPSSEELARTRLEVMHYMEARGVTHCPTRYATITQACVHPTLPAMPLRSRKARRAIRRRRPA